MEVPASAEQSISDENIEISHAQSEEHHVPEPSSSVPVPEPPEPAPNSFVAVRGAPPVAHNHNHAATTAHTTKDSQHICMDMLLHELGARSARTETNAASSTDGLSSRHPHVEHIDLRGVERALREGQHQTIVPRSGSGSAADSQRQHAAHNPEPRGVSAYPQSLSNSLQLSRSQQSSKSSVVSATGTAGLPLPPSAVIAGRSSTSKGTIVSSQHSSKNTVIPAGFIMPNTRAHKNGEAPLSIVGDSRPPPRGSLTAVAPAAPLPALTSPGTFLPASPFFAHAMNAAAASSSSSSAGGTGDPSSRR